MRSLHAVSAIEGAGHGTRRTGVASTTIGIKQSGPPEFAGVAGAMWVADTSANEVRIKLTCYRRFNYALQIGLSITLACLTVIQASVAVHSPVNSFAPARAQHAFMSGMIGGGESACALVFYRAEVDEKEKEVILGECCGAELLVEGSVSCCDATIAP